MNNQTVGSYDEDTIPPEIVAAYREAEARGLPSGWTCSIDKRNRRKWTAPNNGRSCDSIPKALAISVEMNLLPPDTIIEAGKRKRTLTPKAREREAKKAAKLETRLSIQHTSSNNNGNIYNNNNNTSTQQYSHRKGDALTPTATSSSTKSRNNNNNNESDSDQNNDNKDMFDDSDSDSDNETPPLPLNPEHSLDCPRQPRMGLPTTIQWDPTDIDGRKIGWKIKIAWNDDEWVDGRVALYDPHTHKHKIVFDTNYTQSSKLGVNYVWIWLRNEQHNIQLATRMVWALVKGFPWWPALVMESNSPGSDTRREGDVMLYFFATKDTSTLRDTNEKIRPFLPDRIDPIVSKNKKKRNAKSFAEACDEFNAIKECRNNAAVHYARKGIQMVMHNPKQQLRGTNLIGKKVQVFRNDVNYPYGESLIGKIHQYSYHQRKWLVSFELSSKTNIKYEATWMNLHSKETSTKIIDKKKPDEITNVDLLPYLFGLEPINNKPISSSSNNNNNKSDTDDTNDNMNHNHDNDNDDNFEYLLKTRCRGCTEYWRPNDTKATCLVCNGTSHLGCLDPPISLETWQRMVVDDIPFVCSRCKPCRGCYKNDILYGCHPHPTIPPMLSFPQGESLDLCSMCKDAYDDKHFCPNCAHTWDEKKHSIRRKQMELYGNRRRKAGPTPVDTIDDITNELFLGSFNGDEVLPQGAKVDPSYFYPETGNWGYTAWEMLVCDGCKLWVHAGCCGFTEKEYDDISSGKHQFYSKEFLCRKCCRHRCLDVIDSLVKEDNIDLFVVPVSEKLVPTYYDMIKYPMDLQTMRNKAINEEYLNYSWIRECFELMVLNALTFNRMYANEWIEAKRFYEVAVSSTLKKLCKAAQPGRYDKEIQKYFEKAEEARKLEEDRVQIDETVEKKDLVAGTLASITKDVTQPVLRESPPDVASCLSYRTLKLRPVDAFYSCWMDCCFKCGSSGAADTFLHCVDCGEAFHSFCIKAPIHSMELTAAAGWRCHNCKICEISGDVPQDETRMLYCEMCDRAFSLDLLDPPLKEAPPGLWVCGQCVDCKSCGNRSEPNGASRTFWSRDPELCFRCGGCEGLLKDYGTKMKCQVCCGLLRMDDNDFVDCTECGAKVHTGCDDLALLDYRNRDDNLTKSKRDQQSPSNYLCPRCIKAALTLKEDQETERHSLIRLATVMVSEGQLGTHPNYTPSELLTKLVEEVDWALRDQWRDEYLAIISEGIRVYCIAKRIDDDARLVVPRLGDVTTKKRVAAQRALRFVTMVKRRGWDIGGLDDAPIDVIVTVAKLAAAFIDVASPSLGIDKKIMPFHDRFVTMQQVPGKANVYLFPPDRIRSSRDVFTIDDDGLIVDIESGVSFSFTQGNVRIFEKAQESNVVEIVKAEPLCGWKQEWGTPMTTSEWRDPRECCLCHLCGDDDNDDNGTWCEVATEDDQRPRLGRLLPMHDGSWVHTSCALWSSEVWESREDKLIQDVEKARSRGTHLKCFGCGLSGATVGCNSPNCPCNYHYFCAKASGALFTASGQVFCPNHRPAEAVAKNDRHRHMKVLMIASERKSDKCMQDVLDGDLCLRIGSLVVHSLGVIESDVDGFHTENYIYPPGYFVTRIFWSIKQPRTRVVYILKVDKTENMQPVFAIIPGDDPTATISGHSIAQVYNNLMEKVRKVNVKFFTQADPFSKLPTIRRTRKKTFGLNGPQFFGFGLNEIRKLLETSPGVEAVVTPITASSPKYKFCFFCSSDPASFVDQIIDLERRRAANRAEKALQNSTGCARTEGVKAVARSGGSGRITRALVRSAEEEVVDNGNNNNTGKTKKGEDKAKADRNLTQIKYVRMKSIPIDQRLVARRSHIHGWGLFTKSDIEKDNPVVEYMGEIIRQPIADKREKEYELSGEGSCYMFRLDLHRIVDATNIGSMARFMNHSCQPNAYAKIITVDTTDGGPPEKKIVVFALRDISSGEEITYDYKFPVEDGSIRCTCGAPNCIGRLN